MNREVHVRFWEGVGVQFSRATQLYMRVFILEGEVEDGRR
jgi:hypothetical protein